MLIPMPIVIPAESASLEDRVRRLEQALVLSFDALQSVVERLESKFGHEFLGPDLKQLTAAASNHDLQGVLDGIERSLTSGEKPAAARQFRDAFGCTWDQAHKGIRQWQNHSREQKLRWLRLARHIKSLESAEPN